MQPASEPAAPTSTGPSGVLHPLDNPVWHALTGPQAGFAVGTGGARRFPVDVSPFSAVADDPDPAAWASLATLDDPDGLWLFRVATVPVAPGWEVLWHGTGDQMVAADLVDPGLGSPGTPLGPDDAGEMLDLVERTRPGPFCARTVDLGGYVGVRVDGRLVAMAGERLRLAGHAEVSAVCTDPDHRGRGLAAALTVQVARAIRARGETPMLHVAHGNPAVQLYERLGFVRRAVITVQALRPPGSEAPRSASWTPQH